MEGQNKLKLLKKGYKRRISYIFILFSILILVTLKFTFKTNSSESNLVVDTNSESNLVVEQAQVQIERIDYSIKSDSDETLAYIYYDKPVIKGLEFSHEINAFFENEKDGWFNGANRLTHFQNGWLQDFKNEFFEARDSFGDDSISKQPFLYTVDSDVVLLNEEYLSIRHIVTVQTAGKRSWYYFGSTFDLQTGELVPIDKLVDINASAFRSDIVSFLSKEALELDQNLTLQEIREVYGKNDQGNYQIQYGDENIELNYEYYYDGESFYIILNHAILLDTGIIMKWNGVLNDDFNAQLIGYIKGNDAVYKQIEY